MPKRPEIERTANNLVVLDRFLLGAFAESLLMGAILEEIDVEKPISQKQKEKLKSIFLQKSVDDFRNLYEAYKTTWKKERGGRISRFRFGSLPSPKEVIDAKKKQYFLEIFWPLRRIYSKVVLLPPSKKSSLGDLLIKAARKPKKMEEVYILLSPFGLDPKVLVDEVCQTIDRELKRE